MIYRKILLSILAFTIVGTLTMAGAGQVYAQTNSNPWSNLSQIIAQKFGLDQNKVQEVVDQFHQQKRQEMVTSMSQKHEEWLNALVKEGKLTEAQKTSILNKLQELKNKYNREDWKNLTPLERKDQAQNEFQELKTWAQSQGIDLSYLKPGMGKWGMHRFMWLNNP